MLVSHLPEFLAALDFTAAVRAMGESAVTCVRQQMLTGYSQPILATGALMNDVSFSVSGNSVTIGSTLPYAIPVHDGSSTLPARPYLSYGILANIPALQQAVVNTLQASPAH